MDGAKSDALYLLGTGTPTPTKDRFGTAYVLRLGADYLMLDCGPAATCKMVRAGLWPTQIGYLLFSHHHFDHNADYPCFMLCRWDQSIGKEPLLRIFGPPPTRQITEKLFGPEGAFACDWQARIGAPVSQSVHANRGGSLPRPAPMMEVRDIGPGEVVRQPSWRVTAAWARHVEPWLESLAYRVDSDRGSIIFAGDTGPCQQVADLAKGADVFVAHCWDHQDAMEADGEAPGQTGTLDAARFARDAEAKTLILAHTGPSLCRPGSRERAICDIGNIFQGRIIFGEEGTVLDLW